ncbi:hypothetical protein [Streptomyces cyaneofuscatus]|uniref:hypothetical protein n=1 Tax=Streptomyces cyaneofuscatus TaxID=66883 RepID=UPI00369308E6
MNDDTGEWLLNSSVAHIHARSEGGPRWDPDMTAEENQSASNLIPLCNDHAAEIDDTPEHYPAPLLQEWKRDQVQECLDLNRSWPVEDSQAAEIAAVSFDPSQVGLARAGATAVVTAVRHSGLMIESARTQRRKATEVVDAWNFARDQATRMMPVFDANGERLRVEPSHMEIAPIREALRLSLNEATTSLEEQIGPLVGELHAVQAASPQLGRWCNWVEDAARHLTHTAGLWSSPPESDDENFSEAMIELRRAAQALADAWRGGTASEPPLRRVESASGESAGEREGRLHRELLESAKPWSRVTHREYEVDLYAHLVQAAGRVCHLPDLPSLTTLDLNMTARLAAGVARNAADATFRDLIVQAGHYRPLAVAGFLLKHLAITAGEANRPELRESAHDKAREILLAEDWRDSSTWIENQTKILHLLGWTAGFSDFGHVRTTVEAALNDNSALLPELLAGITQWSETLDDGWGGVARGPKSFIRRLPEWFPTSLVVTMIADQIPEAKPADQDESERHTYDLHRYASQVLWLATGNPPSW